MRGVLASYPNQIGNGNVGGRKGRGGKEGRREGGNRKETIG